MREPNRYQYVDPTMRMSPVITSVRGDVNGDNILDYVYVTGFQEPHAAIVRNITLVIQDGATGALARIPLKENMGYDPSLFLGDFTGDQINDIFITIHTGGSGGTTYNYIYSYVHNRPQLLFDSEVYNQMYEYEVTFQDDYKVEILSKNNKTMYLIDLALRDPDYLNEIYAENGKLKTPISGWVDPISGLYPIDVDFDHVYELLAYQKIAGRYHADSLGFIQNRLKWNGSMFTLAYQDVAIYGSMDESAANTDRI